MFLFFPIFTPPEPKERPKYSDWHSQNVPDIAIGNVCFKN